MRTNKIDFYMNETLLGSSFVEEGSSSNDRVQVAREIGINSYNRFVLEDGRMDSSKITVNGKIFNDFDYLENNE